MLEDLIENVDRAWAALNAHVSLDFVTNCFRFHEQLLRDTRTSAILEDLRCEEAESALLLNEAHREIAVTLTHITDTLEREAGHLFAQPPEDTDDYDASVGSVRRRIARVEVAVADPFAVGRERTDGNELSEAIEILLGVAGTVRHATAGQLRDAQRHFDHANRARRIFYLTSAASSLVMIERHLFDLHPPRQRESHEAEVARMGRVRRTPLQRTPLGEIAEAIFGVGSPNLDDERLNALIEGMRFDVRRIYEDVRRRIGAERSLLAVVQRYKQKCQWYDAERLRQIADHGTSGKPEDRLVETLAAYLFEHGLNPLTQPLMGKVRPDLLDAHTRFSFYVEGKQYTSAAVSYLLEGMQQVWDMLAELRGSAFDIREAFYVIYRRSGPIYNFHPRVQHGDRVVHVLVIDIAPTTERGSRAPETRTFSLEELLPKPATPGTPDE